MKLTILTIFFLILLPPILLAQNNNRTMVNIPSLQIPALPEVRVRDISMPSVPVLNRAERLQKVKLQCPAIQASLPSLVLKGNRKNNSLVNLEWITKNAYSFDRFYVERSLGDTLHFETVNDRWAKSINGIRDEYKMRDENSYEKLSYYRLRVLLHSGSHVYSNVAEVKGYASTLFRLYPNPALTQLNLSLRSAEQGEAIVSINDMGGKKRMEQTLKLSEGLNHQQLVLSGLNPGVYTLSVTLPGGNKLSASFLKL